MKKTFTLFVLLALASILNAQQAGVTKSAAAATLDQITSNLTFGSGKTLTATTGATVNLGGATVTLPATVTGGTSSFQPLDADLTAIAALSTTATGRSLLAVSLLTNAGLGITNGAVLDTIGAKTQTGTGNLVLATSPTLVTPTIDTITASAATPLTLNGGTSGASLVLGATTSGQVTFTKASGDVQYKATSGTKIAFFGTDSGNSYVGALSNDNLDLWAGAANKARLTSTGNLLIGTTTDMTGSGNLTVAGGTILGSTGGLTLQASSNLGAGITLKPTTSGQVSIYPTGGNAAILNYYRTDAIKWQTYVDSSDSYIMRDAVNGVNVAQVVPGAIGAAALKVNATTPSTTTTSGALQVVGGVGVVGNVNAASLGVTSNGTITNISNGGYLQFVSDGSIMLRSQGGGANQFTVNQAGGISTTGSVTAAGQIKTSSATTPDLWLQNTTGATGAYRNILLRQNADSTAEFLSVSDAGVLTRANILTINNDSGAVGVGMDATGTNGFAVAGAATIAGAVTANGQLIGKGTATNDSAATGYIGEYVENSTANTSGTAVSLTTNTVANVSSISLTAGDWDVSCMTYFVIAGGSATAIATGITQTSATFGGTGSYAGFTGTIAQTTFADNTQSVPVFRVKLTGTTTVYLVARSTFPGTCSAYGMLSARRVR